MKYELFRESMQNIKKLAENYTNLNQSELNELQRLNAQCLSMKEGIIASFKSVVDELEDGLPLLIDRLAQMKKDADRISGPEGTLEDTLQLESAWRNSEGLINNIRLLLGPGTEKSGSKDGTSDTIGLVGPPVAVTALSKTGVHEQLALSRNEAAAATEKATAAKLPYQDPLAPKALKSGEPDRHSNNKKPDDQNNAKKNLQKKDQKGPHAGHFNSKALPVNKSCGETEKKIIEEISKNMELIKGSKKKL